MKFEVIEQSECEDQLPRTGNGNRNLSTLLGRGASPNTHMSHCIFQLAVSTYRPRQSSVGVCLPFLFHFFMVIHSDRWHR